MVVLYCYKKILDEVFMFISRHKRGEQVQESMRNGDSFRPESGHLNPGRNETPFNLHQRIFHRRISQRRIIHYYTGNYG